MAQPELIKDIESHVTNADIHVTAEEKAAWNTKVDKPYLTFKSPNSFTLKVNDATKHWDGTLEYSTDTSTWSTWNGTTTLSSTISENDNVLYLRGTGNKKITGSDDSYKWVLTGSNIACIGNIENLLDYATVASGGHPTMAVSCYAHLFQGCTSLIQAPVLSAIKLAAFCYQHMFSGCSNLTQVPALSAITLADSCCQYMFYGCTSLTRIPALPATTLAESCYQYMFNNCTGLKLSTTQTEEYTIAYRIPSSGAGTTARYALNFMFGSTGGTFTGTPEIDTIYYLSSDNMVVYDTEVSTLIEYVGSIAPQKLKAISITLSATSWNSSTKTQTVTVSGVLADETKQLITPAPALASQTAYYEAVVLCTGQAADQLTFTAKKIPTDDLTVYVTIQEVGA